jgi:polyphenol oxidase
VFLDQLTVGPVRFAFTDRHGGVSAGPFASLDFGSADGQDPADLQANRTALARAVGLPAERLVFAEQVHGNDVALVGQGTGDPPVADALVTTEADLALVIRIADCVPLLMADPEAGVIAAVHAGRRGAVVGVAPMAVQRMLEAGARVEHIVARLGPSICGHCYEVPLELRDEVAAAIPAAAATTSWGTPAIDVPAAVMSQLHDLGIVAQRVAVCTRETSDLYSYRRDHRTGRSVGLVWRESLS